MTASEKHSDSAAGPAPQPATESLAPTAESELLVHTSSELVAHLATPGRAAAYRRMLLEFGVDPESEEFAGLADKPCIMFVEQPGSWLTPRDLVRVRLLERLIDRGGFDAVRSGVRTLSHDRFTAEGDKAVLLDFKLHQGLGPARLLGSMYLRRFKHRTYASLHVQAKSYQRMRSIWDYSLQMLGAADVSAERFVEEVNSIFESSAERGARDVLPANNTPADLLRIGADLRRCRLEPAFKALWPARARLTKDVLWDVYWNAVNSEFLEVPIGSLSAQLGRIVMAVNDPVKMARRLHLVLDAAADEPISVAGLVLDDDVFRIVLFDPHRERFFVEESGGVRREIGWDEVRASAAEERGGRPSGVLEYLFLAAAGCYFVVDPCDHVQPFHERACAIHQEAVGLKFPWLTFEPRGSLAEPANCFTDIFRPGFATFAVDVLSSFLER